jgi:UDP-N-acetylglucosamine diphosphorylase / glucose-1-phosphate thymidylyltransferase / UDP-N-acetylgalactosamine diphosphorylase / glucosamine-1-phosphate N-acetyltransferase / galactosamine-1-phosphate N-acetyltransferase
MVIPKYAEHFSTSFPELSVQKPWEITQHLEKIIRDKLKTLSTDFIIQNEIAIHKNAKIEEHVILKGPIIISADCFLAAHAYLRGGVFLADNVVIGPGCEVKSSIILNKSNLAHFNFVGDSIVGSFVNLEAGSIIANHYNERKDKTISVLIDGKIIPTSTTKFGGLIGDHTKIGANAVLSPGTILPPNSIVKRLELVDQCKEVSR